MTTTDLPTRQPAGQRPTTPLTRPGWLRRRLRRGWQANLALVPALIVVSFVWIYPFLWVIFTAFKTQRGVFTSGSSLIPDVWEFGNFARAWTVGGFERYFFNTVFYTIAATVIEVGKAALCGYVLARYQFPGRNFLYRLVIVTLFAPIAGIIIPQFVLVDNLGLLGTRAGVVLAMTGGAGALYVLFFTGFFQGLPDELFDAAAIDGAGFLRTFWLVLPLAKPVIGMVVIFQFVSNWNEFVIPLVFTLGQPDLQNLAVGLLSFRGAEATDWTGFAAAMSLSFLPVLIIFFAFQKYFVRGLAGAIKG